MLVEALYVNDAISLLDNSIATASQCAYSADVSTFFDEVTTPDTLQSKSKVATPTASPVAGAVESGTTVILSCSTDGASIHYTDDGTTPTASSPVYSTGITIDSAKTIKAIAVKSGMANSDVMTAVYTISEWLKRRRHYGT